MPRILQNRYQIERQLGRGGMGLVWLAEDRNLPGRWVALKENAELGADEHDLFQQEALILARLQHPNLPRVSDYFSTPDGHQFLVMDYIDGDNLKERLQREGPMPEEEVRACARNLLSALDYLHHQQDPATGAPNPVIHRDIKPANIKQMADGRYMLLDFGIAKVSVGSGTMLSARAMTHGYAPIEQYHGGTDARSDIYSLGITLYSLLTAKMPPSATSMADGAPVPPVRTYNKNIAKGMVQVIEQAMALRRDDRCQSAAEMYQALLGEPLPSRRAEGAAAGQAGPTAPTTRRGSGRTTGHSKGKTSRKCARLPMVLITLLIAWIVIVIGWLLLEDAPSAQPAPGVFIGEQSAAADGATAPKAEGKVAVQKATVPVAPTNTLATQEAAAVEPAAAGSVMAGEVTDMDGTGVDVVDASPNGPMATPETEVGAESQIDTEMQTSGGEAGTEIDEIGPDMDAEESESNAGQEGPLIPTPTDTTVPTSTPIPTSTPLPTRTPIPSRTASPSATMRPTATTASTTVVTPKLASDARVTLVRPFEGDTLNDSIRWPFLWTALPGGLPAGSAYELIFWRASNPADKRSPVGITEDTSAMVDLSTSEYSLGHIVEPGRKTCWGVRLWDVDNGQPGTMLSDGCRSFIYTSSGNGSGGGGNDVGGGGGGGRE